MDNSERLHMLLARAEIMHSEARVCGNRAHIRCRYLPVASQCAELMEGFRPRIVHVGENWDVVATLVRAK